MVKVHCHSQEYWFVGRAQCRCGGKYDSGGISQSLERRGSTFVDVLSVPCRSCGAHRAFEFDISSFYGKVDASSFQKLLSDQEQLWQMYIWHELKMEALIKYLSDLADSGDKLAIAYVAEAVEHFLAKTRSAQTADQCTARSRDCDFVSVVSNGPPEDLNEGLAGAVQARMRAVLPSPSHPRARERNEGASHFCRSVLLRKA